MLSKDLFLDFFVALFALLNPFFIVPVFLTLTATYSEIARQRVAAVAATTVLCALVVAVMIGDQLLDFLGIQVGSFQIAGGLIVLMLAFGMLKGESAEQKDAEDAIEEQANAPARGKDIAVYPLAIPLLAGPAVFVTTIVFSVRVNGIGDLLSMGGSILAIALVVWLTLALGTRIARLLSKTAVNIATRILGILLAAIAVEMMIAGIDRHFGLLIRGG